MTPSVQTRLIRGMIAGAAGTLVLDIVTYADMALRGRPASSMPATVAGDFADKLGLSLGSGEQRDNRAGALGALLGYATGVGVGAVYGLIGPRGRLGAALAGSAAMAGADVPMVAAGYTDPRTWGLAGWLSDLVPHAAFGWATAAAYDAFRDR